MNSEDELLISRIQSLHHCLEVGFHDEEDGSVSSTLDNRRATVFPGSTSVQVLSPVGIVLVDEMAKSRFCGFAFAFERLAKSLAFSLNACSSNCISEVSCSLLFKFVTTMFKPWEILTHEWELCLFTDLILISTPVFTLQATGCNFQYGPNLGVPSNPTFSGQMIFHLLAKCVRIIQCLLSWSTVDVNRCQESCISTNLDRTILLWSPFHSFLVFLQ